jgi:hypothetical protein
MLRSLIGRIRGLLPNRCKEMLVNRELKAMGSELGGAPKRIAETDARRFQFSGLEIPPRGPDPLIPSADL